MFKSKTKLFILCFLVIALISSYCFASEPTPTSLVPGDNAKVISEESITTDETLEDANSDTDSSQAEILHDDLFLIDDTVTMNQLVDGNVYICATTANITGQINGNLFVIAENVTLDGAYVASSAFICSANTTFNAACNDLYFIGNSLDVSYDSYIARDSRIAGNNITFKGLNYRNMYLNTDSINFGEGDSLASIQGNLNYSSSNELTIPEGLVSGEVNYTPTEINENTSYNALSEIVGNIISALVFGIAIYWAFRFFTPKFVENISNFSKVGKFFSSGLMGLISLIVIPIIAIILLITIYGLGLSIALLAVYALILSISFTAFSLFVTKLLKIKLKKISEFCVFMFVIIVLTLTKYIPYVGYFLSFIYGIFGFGMIMMSLAKKNIISQKNEETTSKEENK